jgi:catechol 2,3-dioxygenase-like lactoylglutathione lyase family enzyme
MLDSASMIGFIPTTDFRRARRFYATTLGLRLGTKDAFALVFDSGGVAIRVVKAGKFTPARFTIMGWRVKDIRESVAELRDRGIIFERYEDMKQDRAGIWTAPGGTEVAWFKDPDGNVLSLSST